MLMKFCHLVFSSLLIIEALSQDTTDLHNGTYLIVAPKTIRSGLPYAVSVNILQSKEPVTVKIRITDPQTTLISEIVRKDVVAIPDSLTGGVSYLLKATGVTSSGAQLFNQQINLNFDLKSLSIFVQTDKAIYKPGSLVHFRIIVVTPDLKPYKGIADIKIIDPNRNVIQHLTNQTIDNGVAGKQDSLKFQLIDEPPLGSWKISADVGIQKVEKFFTVDKYVLPKFDVTVKPLPYLSDKDDAVVTIVSKYTYGKGVAGSVTVIANKTYYWEQGNAISKTAEMSNSGETIVRFTNAELRENNLIRNDSSANQIRFIATVTEILTGVQRNGTGMVTVYRLPYSVKINLPSKNFKPGLDFSVSVVVTTPDGKPLPAKSDRSLKATITYSKRWHEGDDGIPLLPLVENLTLDSEGIANLVIKPHVNASSIHIIVVYPGIANESTVSDSRYIASSLSPTHSFIQLLSSSTSVTTGEKATFTVKMTDKIDNIQVQVMSRGYMVYSDNIKATGNNAEFKIPISYEMAPKARIIVYGVRSDNKEILVDAMDIKVAGLFTNNVSIDVDPKRAEPNDSVSFKIRASPKSYIGLLAVDQSVLLLKSGNDITADMVENDIAQYSSGGSFNHRFPFRGKRKGGGGGWVWGGGKDAYTVFEDSGVSVLTDAFLYHAPPPPVLQQGPLGGNGFNGPSGDARLLIASPVNAPLLLPPPKPNAVEEPKVRKWFTEVWIWTDVICGEEEAGEYFLSNARDIFPGNDETRVRQEGEPNSPSIPKIRSRFPETWLWTEFKADANGEAVYTASVPDTITSWITSAFALHDTDGFGVAPEPTKLEVFRPFFISLNLPYSVKRGEKLALQVLIFNYMSKEQTVTVTLDHNANSGFDFIEKTGTTKDKKSKDLTKRSIKVSSDGSATVYFPILPTKIGEIKFLVKAFGQGVSDAVEMPLLIEAEGFPLFRNKPFIVDLSSNNSWSNSLKLDIPSESVNGSQRAYVSVFGDMLGSALNNLDSLIQMPSGCGEQTMLGFVPNIVVTRYLKATNRLTPELAAKTNGYMQSGYQREMTYQRNDNSYSAFGQSDPNGSTWLTAFVTHSFHQAKPYIFVDDVKLKQSLQFLKNQQKENGVFTESGTIHHKDMQGGSGEGGVALTAYVLISLLENDESNENAIKYLERNIERIGNDTYALAIVSYALHLAKSAKKEEVFKLLDAQAVEKDGSKYWTKPIVHNEKEPSYWNRPRPVDVEMTSYVLQTYLLRKKLAGALPIIKWLISQQNENGGFSSTQDTVMAIQGLAAYAEKTYFNKIDVSLDVENGKQKHTFKVNPANSIVQQSLEVTNLDQPIKLSAKGKGQVFAQVNYHYNLLQLENAQPFTCTKDVIQSGSRNIQLALCCKYNLKDRSNMALMEVNAPSGYAIDNEELNHLKTSVKDLQRVELERGDSKANIYFNSLGSDNVCFKVALDQVYVVADQKPALIKLYDYYNPTLRIEFDYTVEKKMTLDDVCGKSCFGDA